MTTVIWCLLIGAVLPLLAKAPLAAAMARQPEGYDNKHPRAQQARLEGFGARALAGHKNAFEALIFFAPGALVAEFGGGDAEIAAGLALTWVAARVVYHGLYLANVHWARSVVWTLGYGAALGLYVTPVL